MSARPVNNTERLNVFFTEQIRDRLKVCSEERGMTVSGLIRMIVLEWLKREDTHEKQNQPASVDQ